jgi:hypothetical protein
MSAFSGRSCSRVSCRATATMTLTYIYAESKAVLGPIAAFSEPHAYDLCARHAAKLTVPNGWSVDREALVTESPGPNEDDLMAIADAIREVVRTSDSADDEVVTKDSSNLGRRGHLRAVPS